MSTLKLYNTDCLEQMKSIPDKSIDLILCDLPYGCLIGAAGAGKKKRQYKDNKNIEFKKNEGIIAGCSWDIKINLELFWKQVKRIRKNDHTPCIHFCSTKFGIDLINSNPKEFRYDLVWNKMRGVGFLTANKKPMNSHEMIYIFSKAGSNYNRIDIKQGKPYFKKNKEQICEQYNIKRLKSFNTEGTRCVLSVIEQYNTAGHKVKGQGQHPTAKPIDLYKWLIERYSNEGDTVLDPTFGSCNSGIACRELKRNYIGIEMNKQFFDKANNVFNPIIE